MWRKILFLILVLIPIVAFAQNDPLTSHYLVRLERSTQYESVCALVRADGSYRLEEEHQKRVFEGLLLGDRLAQLRKTLDDPAVVALSQAQIEAPAIEAASYDHMRVTVARDTGWQDLRFRAPDRKPAKDQVEALQDLLGDLRKAPKARLADSDANQCIPPPSSAPSRVTAPGAAPDPPRRNVVVVGPVVWMRTNHVSEDIQGSFSIRADRKCLLVAHDGTFRFEKTTQLSGDKLKGKAYQGSLTPESMQTLQAILAAPELVNAQQETIPSTNSYGDTDGIDVDIPRPDGHQFLHTRVVSGVARKDNRQLGAGGFVHRNYAFGPIKQLQPLESWFHKIEKQKMEQIKDAVLNDCKSLTVQAP